MTWNINIGDSWYFLIWFLQTLNIKQKSLAEFCHILVYFLSMGFHVPGEGDSGVPVPVCWLAPLAERLMSCASGLVAHEVRWLGGATASSMKITVFGWWIMVNCYVKFSEGKRILQKHLTKYDIWVACFCWWFEVQGNKNISFGNQMWLAGKSLINVGFTGHLSIPHRTALKEPQMSLLIHAQRQSLPPIHYIIYALWLFNIAMGNVPFMDDLLVFTS